MKWIETDGNFFFPNDHVHVFITGPMRFYKVCRKKKEKCRKMIKDLWDRPWNSIVSRSQCAQSNRIKKNEIEIAHVRLSEWQCFQSCCSQSPIIWYIHTNTKAHTKQHKEICTSICTKWKDFIQQVHSVGAKTWK